MVADGMRRHLKNEGHAHMNLSFAGCGFLGIYHVGVASCFKEYAPHLIQHQISGASAGALVAAAAITNCCLGDATTYTLRISAKARQRALGPLHPAFHLVKYLREGLNTFLPDNAHEIANGRLNISLTRVSDRQNVVVNQYDSKEELIQALVCSSFIPFYCGIIPPKYRGVRYVDGGLSDNIPVIDDNTLTVSPFAGESDICPTDSSANDMHIHLVNTSIQCTMGNLYRASYAFFPPHPEVLTETCKQGFDDALRFLQKNTIINISRHLALNSCIVTEEANVEDSMETDSCESSSDSDSELEEYSDEDNKNILPPTELPSSVVTALKAECDSVNKSMLTPLYNMKMFKVISLMTAPWLLPVDVTIVLAQRLYEWMPYVPRDMQWFVKELIVLAQEVIQFIQQGRHRYSARFSCQMAITEFDSIVPSSVATSTPASSPFVHRRLTMEATQRHHHHRASKVDHQLPSLKQHLTAGFNGPVRCADDLRHEILENGLHNNYKLKKVTLTGDSYFMDETENLEAEGPHKTYGRRSRQTSICLSPSGDRKFSIGPVSGDRRVSIGPYAGDRRISMGPFSGDRRVSMAPFTGDRKSEEGLVNEENEESCDTNYDQFEHVLEVADKMDSILAFYYTEEENPGVVKVTEIYALEENCQDIRSRSSSFSVQRMDNRHPVTGKRTKEKLNTELKKTEFAASLDSGLQQLQQFQQLYQKRQQQQEQ